MDQLSSQEGEIPITIPVPIPIPINTSFGSGGHGHLIHHHQQQRPHDPTAAATARAAVPHNNNKNDHSNFLPSSTVVPQNQTPHNTNGSNPMPTSLDHSHEEEEEQEEEHHDHVNNANANVVPYKYNTYNNKKQAVVGHNGVRYKECLKNHAAAMGGTATDGCGEFMPSGEEGTIEALNCSACNCHRNFHRKEVEGEQQQLSSCDYNFHHTINRAAGVGSRKFLLSHEGGGGGGRHKSLLAPPQYPHQHQMIMSNYNMGMGMIEMVGSIPSDQSDEQEDHHHHRHHGGGGGGTVGSRPAVGHVAKKRFRTKFTHEQKEKMLNFAEKVGWKIQKQEDSFVQNFCQEIGVKRRVLKVWMHNNKHNLANKINPPPPPPPAP
ncbi:hypothetical protein ACFX2I_020225 [Malus domestica]